MDEWRSQSAENLLPPRPVPMFLTEVRSGDWNRRAVQLGTVAGKAVALFRRTRRQWYEFDRQQAAGDAAKTLRRETVVRSEEWRQAFKRRSAELRRHAKAGYERTRGRAELIGRDYPVHVVVVAVAAGFVLGVGLRVWRSRSVA